MREERPKVHFRRITAATVWQVCALSLTLSPEQRRHVADNAVSIAQAHFCPEARFRAIYAGDELVGFIMLHWEAGGEDGPGTPEVFLWRFMIAGPHQGKKYGRRALERLLEQLKARGIARLTTSVDPGAEGPEGFYRKLGFVPNGDKLGDEIVLELDL